MDYNSINMFSSIPDTVFITDSYGFILDFNRTGPFGKVKKGMKLKRLIPDWLESETGIVNVGDRVYRRQTSTIMTGDDAAGYTVMLADITAESDIIEKRRQASRNLERLISEMKSSNEELENFTLQVKVLTDYAEQLRIAQIIHDDAGHAITELHAICQMCLRLKDSDPEQYGVLISEGIGICRKAVMAKGDKEYESLNELIDNFVHQSRIPVDRRVRGTEPAFIKERYPLIERMCLEAYHNTLDHSLADRMIIDIDMSDEKVVFTISDNGKFSGRLEKGFGLKTMEEYVAGSGGSVEFVAKEGEGFTIKAEWKG